MGNKTVGATLRVSGALLAICTVAAWLLSAATPAISPRDILWIIVHDECVPDQMKNHDPKPCVRVDLDGGIEKGFAILKDIQGHTQFLLIPTATVSGIESPLLLSGDTPNYFADAWEARRYINEALHRVLPRDNIGLAINSLPSRSQDQLHIHVDCIRPDVQVALQAHEGSIGDAWAQLDVPLSGRRYQAMWVPGETLDTNDPFRLLAQGIPGASQDMADWTLVAVGSNRANGAPGFILLADHVNRADNDTAHGEDLMDHSCAIAASVAGSAP